MPDDPLHQVNVELLGLLDRLPDNDTQFDSSHMLRPRLVALYLLCRAGSVELDVKGRAWTDHAALRFQATLTGLWIDADRRSILPDEFRRVIPAWAGRPVAVQVDPILHVRLTEFGQRNQQQIAADNTPAFLLSAFIAAHPVRGKVRLRILEDKIPIPGVVPEDSVTGAGQPPTAAQIAKPHEEITPKTSEDSPGDQSADYGGPQPDPADSRKVLWAGKSIYLGHETVASRLFWLLARHVGSIHGLANVQRAINGFTALEGTDADEIRKANQRVRKAVSEVRRALRNARMNRHVTIVREGSQKSPTYSMIWRYPK
jgi:hypothetical protein